MINQLTQPKEGCFTKIWLYNEVYWTSTQYIYKEKHYEYDMIEGKWIKSDRIRHHLNPEIPIKYIINTPSKEITIKIERLYNKQT